MAMFDNSAKDFFDRLNNIDTSGIHELIQEVNYLTANVTELGETFSEMSQTGTTLTKTLRNAWKSVTEDIKNAEKAENAVRQAMEATWNASKTLPKSQSSEKKSLVEKLNAYKELEKAVQNYQSTATSASKAGEPIHNERSASKTRARVIDTGDSNQPVQNVAPEQVKAQVESLRTATEETSKALSASFSTESITEWANALMYSGKSIEQMLDEIDKKMAEINAEMEQMDEAKKSEGYTHGSHKPEDIAESDRLSEEIAKDGEALDTLRSKITDIRFQDAFQKADTSWIDKEKMSLEELKATYAELKEEKASIESKKSLPKMNDAELQDYAQVIASMSKIREKMMASDNKAVDKQTSKDTEQETEQEFASLQELKDCIAETKAELDSLRERAKNGEIVDFRGAVEEAKVLEAELKRLESMRNALEGKPQKENPQRTPTSKNVSPKASTTDTEQEQQKVHGLIGTLRELVSVRAQLAAERTGLPFSSDAEASQAHINGLEGRLKGLQTILGSMKGAPAIQAITGAFSAVGSAAKTAVGHLANFARQGLDAIINGAQRVGSALASVASTGFHALVSSAQGAVSAFNALNSGARSVISTIASLASKGFGALKTGIGAAISGVQGLIGKFKNLSGDATKKLSHSIMSIKSMLIRRIKRTFITSIFNQAKEGLQEFARYSDTFNQSMSSIKNGAKEAAGNMAVTLGNLVNLIAPALNTLLSLLSSVFQAINSIFALLGGKSTVTTAKKSTDNYAKSLKSAGGAAKDLNHQLYGFDEITRQEDNSGGGGGGSKIGYEESAINENLKSIFDKIKEAWEADEYEKVGMLIAEQLNNIIYTIDDFFIAIRPKAVEWASNIARVLNGLVEGWDAWATGKMLGDGLNLILDTVNTFLKTFKAMRFGEKLAEMLNGLFDTVEWDLLGETVAQYFSTIWRVLAGFVKDAKWKEYGQKLGTAVNSFFANFDFEAMRNTIVNGINGLVDSLMNFIQTVEVDKITKQLASNIRRIITRIQWKKMGEMFATYINSAITGASNLFDSKSISLLGRKIGVALENTLENVNWTELGKTAAKGLAEIQKAFTNFVDAIDLPNLGSKLATGIQSMFDNIDWDARKQMVTTSVNDVFKGIGNAIRGVRWNEFAQQAANNANSIIEGIEWTEIGKTLSDGINAAFGSLSTFVNTFKWGDLGSRVASGLQTFAENINWEDVRGTISGFINGLTDLFTNFVDGVNWEQIGKDVTANLNTLVTTDIKWDNISGLLSGSISNLIDLFKPLTESDTIKNLASKLGGVVNNVLKDIKWADLGRTIAGGIGGLTGAFKAFVGRVGFPDIAGKLAEGINTFFDPSKGGLDFGKAAGDVAEGINGIIKGFDTLLNGNEETGVEGINFEQMRKSLSEGITTLISDTDISGVIGKVGKFVTDMVTEFGRLITDIFEPGDGKKTLGEQLSEGINGIFKTTNASGEEVVDTKRFEELGKSISNAIGSVLSDINTWITGVDWGAIGESVGVALGSIDWPKLAGDILTLLWNALNVAISLAGGFMGGLLRKIFGVEIVDEFEGEGSIWAKSAYDGFANEFQEGTVRGKEALFKSAAMWASGFGEGFSAQWEESENTAYSNLTEFVNALVTMGEGEEGHLQEMANHIGSFPYDVAKAIVDSGMFAETSADEFMQSIYDAETADQIRALFGELGADIPSQFIDELLAMHEPVVRAGHDLLYAVQDAETAQDVIDAFGRYGVDISEEFADKIRNQGAENTALALEMMGKGISEKAISVMDVSNLSSHLKEYMEITGGDLDTLCQTLMNGSIEDIKAIATTLGVDVGKNLGDVLPEALKTSLQAGEAEVEEEKNRMANVATLSDKQRQEMQDAAEKAAKGSTSGFVEKTAEGKSDVTQKTGEVTSAVKETYEALPDDVKPYAEQLIQYVCAALEDKDGTVKAAIEATAQAAVDRAREILASDVGMEIARAFIGGMQSEIQNTFASKVSDTLAYLSADAVVDVAGRLSSDNGYTIINWFLDGMQSGITQNFNAKVLDTLGEALSGVFTLLNSVDWGNAGYKVTFNLLEGMNEAILRNDDTLVANIQRMCQAMVDTAKEVFDEHSPSRVFNQIGSYVMEGMENGLLDSGKDAITAVSEVAQAMIDEGSGVSLQASFDTMNSGLDVATDKLTQLANIFSNIAETLVEMGGLHIPTIATGQSIPYRTQLGATPMNGFGTSDNPHALEDALYNAFTRAMGSSGAEQDINITLSVDGRKMADIVSKYQRQQGRAWGV